MQNLKENLEKVLKKLWKNFEETLENVVVRKLWKELSGNWKKMLGNFEKVVVRKR